MSIPTRILDYADRIETLLAEHGDAALQATLLAAQIEAVRYILLPIVFVLAAGFSLRWSVKAWRWADGVTNSYDAPIARTFALLAFAVPGAVFAACLTYLLNPWLWIALVRPELYIARNLLASAGAL